MSEEEKKAIEIVKGITESDLLDSWDCEENYNAIQILLNLIEKQNKKIEELERDNKIRNDIGCGLMKELLVNYIPKSVIRQKIEEYRKERNKLADGHFYDRAENANEDTSLFIAGEVLKELLGEKE